MEPTTLQAAQYSELDLTGDPGGFVRDTHVLTNKPDYGTPSTKVWKVVPKEEDPKQKLGPEKRARSYSNSSTGSTSSDKTSPTKSPDKKFQKTSSTTSEPRTSGAGVQPSTSGAGVQPSTSYNPEFDASSIHPDFRRYCAVVDRRFSGRKYWQMKLTLVSVNNPKVKEGEVTLCEVGFAPVGRFETSRSSLAHPHGKTFIVKIGMKGNRWRALWAHNTDRRSWTDLSEVKQDLTNQEYTIKFGLFLDTLRRKITFYTADRENHKLVFTSKLEYDEGYPILSLGESELRQDAIVRLETMDAIHFPMISERASKRDTEEQKKLDATKPAAAGKEQETPQPKDSEDEFYKYIKDMN